MKEKLFPISINPSFCKRCQKCEYSCPPKAIFFKNSMRYVDYDKCQGCLKCVEVCEHGAIEVVSLEEGKLERFEIDKDKCLMCKQCLEEGFCFKNLFKLGKDEVLEEEQIIFEEPDIDHCIKCLKCFRSCPNNAIIPIIKEV